jgi:BirA family biotin operon repressor/biotin-[acetyl-CoA-carboxylase] ligase
MFPASAPLPPEVAAAVNGAIARGLPLRLDVRWYASVTSTMDVASDAVQSGAAEGLVVLADEQTAGRGRRGRTWSSPPGGGLYLSIVLRPPDDARGSIVVATITLAAGVAVREAILHATGLAADLKWPNDLLVGRRKVAGILAEGAAIGSALQTVVLGIGINVQSAAHPDEIVSRATSLESELGRPVERMRLLEELLVAVAARYDDLRRGEVDGILRAWRAAAPFAHGAAVEWDAPDGVRRGVTAGVDDAGALLVRTRAGVDRLVAGEVRWID